MSGPPKEGTPNGGDRLAEIEGRSREELSVAPWLAYPNDRRLETARDVLALVEIARAARVCYERGLIEVTPDSEVLERALARLDRSSSDGTADSAEGDA